MVGAAFVGDGLVKARIEIGADLKFEQILERLALDLEPPPGVSIKAYRTTRKREKMRLYITGLSDADIRNLAGFYALQKSTPSERAQTLVRDLTEKCDRCHGAGVEAPGMPVPKIGGQDRDYLMMALRAYRDDRRESTTMHKMSLPYGDSIIESIASYYAAQPAK